MEDELEMATVRHRPEALELLEAQSKFTKKELQILYRGFKNVRTSFSILPSPSSQRSIEKREGKRAITVLGEPPSAHFRPVFPRCDYCNHLDYDSLGHTNAHTSSVHIKQE